MIEFILQHGWEALAVALSITYLLLAVRENIWCWAAGFASNAIYLFVFWGVSLLMDSALQVYYMAIAVYGWWQWRQGGLKAGGDNAGNMDGVATSERCTGDLAGKDDLGGIGSAGGGAGNEVVEPSAPCQEPSAPCQEPSALCQEPLPISRWSASANVTAILAVCALSLLTGFALQQHTEAASPFLDSFTTWGAVLTTWMVARKLLENWLYWIVIDSVSIYLYISRDLDMTAALFAAYTLIAVFGYRQWLARYRSQSASQIAQR